MTENGSGFGSLCLDRKCKNKLNAALGFLSFCKAGFVLLVFLTARMTLAKKMKCFREWKVCWSFLLQLEVVSCCYWLFHDRKMIVPFTVSLYCLQWPKWFFEHESIWFV